jgi:hypothetical protein
MTRYPMGAETPKDLGGWKVVVVEFMVSLSVAAA